MQDRSNGRPPPLAGAPVSRLRAAELEARGVIGAIANCGRAGVLSPEAVSELNELYLYRVELLLETASFLERTAQAVRLLLGAMARIRRDERGIVTSGGVSTALRR